MLGHARRIQGYLVAKSQSHKVIVIVNKASVNGGYCQDSSLSWLVVKVFSTTRRRLGAARHIRRSLDTESHSSHTRVCDRQ